MLAVSILLQDGNDTAPVPIQSRPEDEELAHVVSLSLQVFSFSICFSLIAITAKLMEMWH